MIIECIGFRNAEQQKAVVDRIKDYLFLFPCWAERLYIIQRHLKSSDLARVWGEEQYRCVRMEIDNSFGSLSDANQDWTIRHEVVHMVLFPLSNWVETRLLDPIRDEDEKLYGYMDQDYTERIEAVTEDLTIKLGRLMGRATEKPHVPDTQHVSDDARVCYTGS